MGNFDKLIYGQDFASMKVRLSKTQLYELMPYFDRVRAAATAGSPGMLVGWLWHDAPNDTYWLEPCFIDHELAQPLIEKGRREIPGRVAEQGVPDAR